MTYIKTVPTLIGAKFGPLCSALTRHTNTPGQPGWYNQALQSNSAVLNLSSTLISKQCFSAPIHQKIIYSSRLTVGIQIRLQKLPFSSMNFCDIPKFCFWVFPGIASLSISGNEYRLPSRTKLVYATYYVSEQYLGKKTAKFPDKFTVVFFVRSKR